MEPQKILIFGLGFIFIAGITLVYFFQVTIFDKNQKKIKTS